MREIVLDTETTGLDPASGHRVVEIGCVELVNHVTTGETFHTYLNPERNMPAEAFAVHGLSEAFLVDKPKFKEIAAGFVDFLGDAPLIIHNAAFDIGFLNAELARLDLPALQRERAVDTVDLARRRFPGAPANLDALCRRFQIDLSDRTLHGALKDAQLLARVYLELIGGAQPALALAAAGLRKATANDYSRRVPRVLEPTAEERSNHEALVATLADSVWSRP